MLRLLGPTRVSWGTGRGLPQAAFLAVAILDLTPGHTLTREALAARLWEGAPANKASASLRTLIKRIRDWEQAASVSLLQVASTAVTRDHTSFPSDLSQFLAVETVDTAASLRHFAELYGGDLLTGVEDSSELTGQWIAAQRAWLRERFIKIALAGAQHVGGALASEVLRRLGEEAPYDDAIVRAAMVAARQDPAQVRALYDRFAARLRADLGNEPEARTETLLRELTNDAPAPLRLRIDEPSPGVAVSVDSIPRVLILPPAESFLPVADRQLGEALIDEVTHALGRMRTFAVFAPHTARQLANAPFPSGNPYGAQYLVGTRFAPSEDGSRLCVSLTRLDTHELLQSEELRFTRDDLSAHHFHLAAAIGTRLASGVERAETRIYRTTGSASAYVHYLLGCEAIRTFELQSVRRAKDHFRRALRLSPDFVPARAMLARTLSFEWLLLDRNEREPIENAVALAREAASIDPLDPAAHREIGHALLYLGALDEGVGALRSATQLGPHNADVLFHYGDGLIHLGDMPEARRVMDRALALNPLAPDFYLWASATADYFLGDFSGASEGFKRLRNPEPAARFLAAVEAMNGNLDEARRQRNIYLTAHPDFRLADYMIPQRRKEDRELYLEGLRRAGFV